MRFILLLLCVLLLGCAGQITSGEITSMEFVPAHDESTVTVTLDYDGNPTVVPDTIYVPDSWYITFQKVDEDNQCKQRTISVGQDEYEKYEIGQWIALER